MRKFMKAIAAIMLMVAVVCAAGCKKPDDPNNGGNNDGGNNGGNGGGNGGGSNPTAEGIYLGIIGFNQHQYEKEIVFLNASTQSTFSSFIDGLQMENLTGLYYADYLALQRMQSYGEPPKLAKVALVTFTDGLDNTSVSPATPELNPEQYPSKEAYLNALNSKIKNDKVHGYSINAYTIGLKGTDALSNLEEFRYNMQMLASSQNNVYEADNVNQVIDNFAEIADDLYSETATASLKLLLPGGYPDGLEMRFTFDGSSTPENSSLYIQCTYRNLGTAIRLESITYHGFNAGESVMESNEVENGFMKFVFVDLTKNNGNLISESDKEKLQVYKKTTTSWGLDSEFDKDQQSHIITEQKSAVIMLVLDCTTSLGTESFAKMKEAAKHFIEILLNSNNGGGGNGGGNGIYNDLEYVDLGLPSGILWATCNVGADAPEDYGDYFAWAETTPKTIYNWSAYQYCMGSNNTLTKYCNNAGYGYNGYTDNLTILQTDDDAAMSNWGSGWRIPTKAEWEELFNNTTHIWTRQNGVNGRLFTALNGNNNLFLPAAGYCYGSGSDLTGRSGDYWSSLFYTDNSHYAWEFYFEEYRCCMHDGARYIGRSVRPVRSIK